MNQGDTWRPRAVIVALTAMGIGTWVAYQSSRVTRPDGRLFSILLVESSLCFLLCGAFLATRHDSHEELQPAGPPELATSTQSSTDEIPPSQPPWMLVVTAALFEFLKAVLLTLTPGPGHLLEHATSTLLTWVSLIAGLVLAALVLIVAGLVGLPNSNSHSKRVLPTALAKMYEHYVKETVAWLQCRPIVGLLCAFSSFLIVTHFLALAVAFDDRSKSTGPALYASAPMSRPASDESGHVLAEVSDSERVMLKHDDRALVLKAVPLPETYVYGGREDLKFFFNSGTASMNDTLDAWPLEKAAQDELCNHKAHPNDDPLDRIENYLGNRMANGRARTTVVRNLLALCTARRWFAEVAVDRKQQDLLIFGHANVDAFDGELSTSDRRRPYTSNSELAAVRAHEVFLALQYVADDLEKEMGNSVCALTRWHVAAGSSEKTPLNRRSVAGQFYSLDPWVSVEVKREVSGGTADLKELFKLTWTTERGPETRRLDLLDYLYFMTYTITTTGYGDLMPIKPATKFIVTAANLIEVAYVAIIFVLIAAGLARVK